MKPGRRLRTVAMFAAAALMAAWAPAQDLPPHKPGSICVTPVGWCWAKPPGRVGWPCHCPTPQGLVRGTLQ